LGRDTYAAAALVTAPWPMPDAVPPVDLASLAAVGNHLGARWRLDGEDL
jgi:hypothetical protein